MNLINKIGCVIFIGCAILLAIVSSLQTQKIHQLEQQLEQKNQQLRLLNK